MKDMRKKIFRKAEEIKAESGAVGHGVILPKSGEGTYEAVADSYRESDIYVYMGDTDFPVGEEIMGFMGRFTVLTSRKVAAFGKCFCTRSLLRRVGEAGA